MKNWAYLISAAAGALMALAFPPYPLYFTAFFAFLPLFFVLENKPLHPLRHIYITFFVFHAATNWWIASWQSESDPWLVASGIAVAIGHPVFFLVPFALQAFFAKRFGSARAMWLFPFVWTAFEYLHGQGDLAYSWLSLGHSQIKNHFWVQSADVVGTYGLGFLIALVNVLMYKLVKNIIAIKGRPGAGAKRYFDATTIRYASAIAAIIIIPSVYGAIRVGSFAHERLLAERPTMRAIVVQPNINPWRKWDQGAVPQINLRKHLSDSVCRVAPAPDLVVWDETAITFLNEDINCKHDFSFIQSWLRTNQSSLLTGFSDLLIYERDEDASPLAREFGKSGKLYDGFNSAVLVSHDSFLQPEIYHKMRLTPFGEQVPYGRYISFATKWMEWGVGISSWTKGTEQKNLAFTTRDGSTHSIAPIICIESIFPDFVRNFSALGAEAFAIITNDAWYDGTFGPEQHFLIASMRAIENRRYVCRSANTGISGFIAPTGDAISRLEPRRPAAEEREIPLLSEKTIYATVGDLLPQASAIAVGLAWIFLLAARKKFTNNFDGQ